MIYITGDTHGGYDVDTILRRDFNKDDVLIICGDFGYIFQINKRYYEVEQLDRDYFLECVDCTVLWVDGNHENFERINQLPIEEKYGGKVHKVTDNCYHLIRGEKYDINGYKFLAIGGAESHDMHRRTEFVNWWKEESIIDEDIEKAIANSKDIDFVLSHTAPLDLHYRLWCGNYIPVSTFEASQSCVQLDKLRKALEDKEKPFKWFLGHYHYDLDYNPYYVLYNAFYCVEKGYWV